MVFSSLTFIFFFLPAALCCFRAVPRRAVRGRNLVLLVFSLVFYFFGEPRLIAMLLLSILANYGFGLGMGSRYRKPLFVVCVVFNLSMLGVFKYLDFFISTANRLLGADWPVTGLIMPIGISFYTFQALSYVIDVCRGDVPPQKNPFDLALYIAMFPQLIAGPIVRYQDISRQLACRTGSPLLFSEGIDRFVFGLGKKVLLSNVFARMADRAFGCPAGELSAAAAWLGAVSYTLQIYFDFSGYSDMAIGLGRMFDFRFPENFNYPYACRSITEFWRRWHISLSSWFRDYVYIPLGGSRRGGARGYWNLLAVWMLTGFWHGANFTFLAWGLYYGVLLILEKRWLAGRLPAVPARCFTLLCVVIGWVIFRSDTLSCAMQYIRAMFCSRLAVNSFVIEYLVRFWPQLLAGLVLSAPVFPRLQKSRAYRFLELPLLGAIFLLCVMSLLSDSYNPFIYFRF